MGETNKVIFMALPSDVTIVGTVLAVAIAVLLLSGLALYVAFRIRETLRGAGGKNSRAVTLIFLIGLLFLSGGVFYFFASGLNSTSGQTSTSTVGSMSSISSSTLPSLTSTGSTSTTSTTSNPASSGVSMAIQCPSSGSSVVAGSTFVCNVTVYDVGTATFQSATLTSSGDFTQFSFQNCTETVDGNPSNCSVASSVEIGIGTVYPGTTTLTLSVQAPATSGMKTCTLILAAAGLGQTVAGNFTIQVTH